MTRFSVDSFKIEDDGESATLLRNVNSMAHNLGIQTSGPDTGNTYNEVRYIVGQAPEFALECLALESLLDSISILTGKCVVDGATEVGLELYGQAHDPCGTAGRLAGSTNMKVLCEHSHLLITQIQGSAGQDAIASVRAICLTDGTNAPTSTVFNSALPASPISDEAFTIAQARIAGTTLATDAIKSVSIDTGIDVQPLTAADSIWPGSVLILKSTPTLRIVTDDISTVQALVSDSGVACTLANSFVSFARRQADAGLYALTATEHIKITFNGFATLNENYNASGRAVGTMEVVIECTEGASVPLVVATNVAI